MSLLMLLSRLLCSDLVEYCHNRCCHHFCCRLSSKVLARILLDLDAAGVLRDAAADLGTAQSSGTPSDVRPADHWMSGPSQNNRFCSSGTRRSLLKTVWYLVGNRGMDPYSSPYIIPNIRLHNPFPHSLLKLLRTRQKSSSAAAGRIPAVANARFGPSLADRSGGRDTWLTQRAQYPLNREYTLNQKGIFIMV